MTQDPGLTHVDEAGAARMVDVTAKERSRAGGTASREGSSRRGGRPLLRGDGVPRATRSPSPASPASWAPSGRPIWSRCATRSRSPASRSTWSPTTPVGSGTVKTTDRTGVEMEALTAVAVAGLAVIDMVKAVDPAAVLSDVRVELKEGGKTGHWERP